MAALQNRRSYSYDNSLLLKDAGLVASSAAAQVSSAAAVVDLGAQPCQGVVVIDATAIEIGSNDECFTIVLQGSNSSTFAGTAAKTLAAMQLGSAGGKAMGESADPVGGGRYELPFINVQNDVVYEYVRLYTLVAGTIATGINYTGFIALDPRI
jgi:hypothetical protein